MKNSCEGRLVETRSESNVKKQPEKMEKMEEEFKVVEKIKIER